MLDLTWKLFSQTGNIEAYLLLKDLENNDVNFYESIDNQNQTTSNMMENTLKLNR